MNWLTLVLIVGATARLTRLVTHDTITAPIRAAAARYDARARQRSTAKTVVAAFRATVHDAEQTAKDVAHDIAHGAQQLAHDVKHDAEQVAKDVAEDVALVKSATPADWTPTAVTATTPDTAPAKGHAYGFISCPWCVSVWIAAGTVGAAITVPPSCAHWVTALYAALTASHLAATAITAKER